MVCKLNLYLIVSLGKKMTFIQHYCGCGGWYKYYPNNWRYTRDDKRFHDDSHIHRRWLENRREEEKKVNFTELWRDLYEKSCVDIINIRQYCLQLQQDKQDLQHRINDNLLYLNSYRTKYNNLKQLKEIPVHFINEMIDMYNQTPDGLPNCVCCMEQMNKENFYLIRDCFHKICKQCWSLCSNKCPICRITLV